MALHERDKHSSDMFERLYTGALNRIDFDIREHGSSAPLAGKSLAIQSALHLPSTTGAVRQN